MPEEKKADDVEKLLSEEKSLEARKQALIHDLLKQRETAIAPSMKSWRNSAITRIPARANGAITEGDAGGGGENGREAEGLTFTFRDRARHACAAMGQACRS